MIYKLATRVKVQGLVAFCGWLIAEGHQQSCLYIYFHTREKSHSSVQRNPQRLEELMAEFDQETEKGATVKIPQLVF